jgi:hypothetical protein
MKYLFILLTFYTSIFASSIDDSLVFKNGNIMDGEIKSMDRGVLQIETDYSDSDFKIEWEQVQTIKTTTIFFVILRNLDKYYGTLESRETPTVSILAGDKEIASCDLDEIVYLQQLKTGFWDRLYASIDVGISLAKANDLRQLTSRSSLGYRTEIRSIEATFNTLRSRQQEVDPIERTEGKIDYRRILTLRWYTIATISLASNTEQKLDIRLNLQLGIGRFLLRSNSAYWGVKLGANRNVEKYSSETPDRSSWEGYLGSELNLFDIGDLNLFTSIMAYQGITEKKRFRTDFNLDIKYDLPYDFYLKIGLTVNYDNIPAEGASETDYVLQTGLGWEW